MYNAKSDIWSKYLDSAHKIISPKTYSCSLCSLTHNNFLEKKERKYFRENTCLDFVFMYKDEFLKLYSSSIYKNLKFPIVFVRESKDLTVILEAEKLENMKTVEQLIEFFDTQGY